MIGSLSMISGLQIIEDMNMPTWYDKPKVKHNWKKSKSKFYNNRVQKKWNKRFGFTKELYFIRNGNFLIANPHNIQRLKEAIK